MKEAMKENIKDFAKVYTPMIAIMLVFACLSAIGGHANGAAACAGIAAIAAAMYAGTIILVVAVELVKICKGEKKWIF